MSAIQGGGGPGVTAPQGFEAAGVAAGLKSSGKSDVAVVVNRGPLKVGAAVFTSNRAVVDAAVEKLNTVTACAAIQSMDIPVGHAQGTSLTVSEIAP